MDKVAVICCYNRQDIMDTMLDKSLKNQAGVEVERLYYQNSSDAACKCFNKAIKSTDAEYLVFVHQDIEFLTDDFLLKTVGYIKNEKRAIYGLCGARASDNKTLVVSNCIHGLWNKKIGDIHNDKLEKVFGLDEIFAACHRDVFNEIQFDEENFDGWHVYLADLCVQANLKDIPVYVMPLESQHKNSLEMPKYMMIYNIYPDDYFQYLKMLYKKYKGKVPFICCPCVSFSTTPFKFWRTYNRMRFASSKRRFFRKISLK